MTSNYSKSNSGRHILSDVWPILTFLVANQPKSPNIRRTIAVDYNSSIVDGNLRQNCIIQALIRRWAKTSIKYKWAYMIFIIDWFKDVFEVLCCWFVGQMKHLLAIISQKVNSQGIIVSKWRWPTVVMQRANIIRKWRRDWSVFDTNEFKKQVLLVNPFDIKCNSKTPQPESAVKVNFSPCVWSIFEIPNRRSMISTRLASASYSIWSESGGARQRANSH